MLNPPETDVLKKQGLFAGISGELPSLALPIIAGIAVGLLGVTLPLMGTAVIFAGIIALLVSVARPVWALYLYFCGVVVLTDSAPMPAGGSFFIRDVDAIEGLPPALTLFFLLMFGMTAARLLIFERRQPPVSLVSVAVFTAIVFVGLVTGISRGGDPDLYRIDFTGMLFPVLCFCLCRTVFERRDSMFRMMYILLAVSAVKAVILAGYYLAGRGWIYHLDGGSVQRISTQDSADLLVFITLLLTVAHLIVRGDLRGAKALAAAVATFPILFVTVFSYRRAQWVGLILSSGLLWLWASKTVRKKIGILMLAVFLAGSAFAVVTGLAAKKAARISEQILSIFDSKQSSNVYHMLESRQVLKDLAGSPLFGLGLGSEHSPLGLYEEDEVPANIVHNTFLYIWMKIGLPGLIFFLWAAVLFFRRFLRFRKTHMESKEWGLVLPLVASTGLWFATFLTGPVPWYLHQTGLMALFAAMTITLISGAVREDEWMRSHENR